MDKKLAKFNTRESNSHNNNNNKDSYLHHEDNNYQNAVIEGFKLLSSQKLRHPKVQVKFDQELCKTLVIKYGLKCSDCKLSCEMHEWEKLRFPPEAIK